MYTQRKFAITKKMGKQDFYFHQDGWTSNKARAKTYTSISEAGTALNLIDKNAKLARVA